MDIPNFCKAQEIYFMSVLAKNSPNYVIKKRNFKIYQKSMKKRKSKIVPYKRTTLSKSKERPYLIIFGNLKSYQIYVEKKIVAAIKYEIVFVSPS
jgi:hypothetical protein